LIAPPKFYETDKEKWHQKFSLSNKKYTESQQIMSKTYNYKFLDGHNKTCRGFSTIDTILLHGNVSDYSHIVDNCRKDIGQINFPFLLRRYQNETSFKPARIHRKFNSLNNSIEQKLEDNSASLYFFNIAKI